MAHQTPAYGTAGIFKLTHDMHIDGTGEIVEIRSTL